MGDFIFDAKIIDFDKDSRFVGIKPFDHKVWLSSPTMHGDEQRFVDEAIQTNWVSTVGSNIDEVERTAAQQIGRKYAVALSSGTAALHLAVRLAGERIYGTATVNRGALEGHKVFCSDMTFDATVNPVSYEGGECVFIDIGDDDWNMDPRALEKAFDIYPDVKLIVLAHLYGTPSAHMEEIREIADRHGALIVEDAAESLGASIFVPSVSPITQRSNRNAENIGGKVDVDAQKEGTWIQTGCFGDYSVVSFNGNKIITGSSGGILLTDDIYDANKCRKWSTQSREDASWYQHEELGYNYRLSNVIAGIVRGQIPYLSSHIEEKRGVWERYQEGVADLPVSMNPMPSNVMPNFWLSCMIIHSDAMCQQVRSERESLYASVPGQSCPDEILDALKWANCEGRPIWKPMHLQPLYWNNPFITKAGIVHGRSNIYIKEDSAVDIGADVFHRGLCLPSDNKMTIEEQEIVIDIIHRCFK